MTSPARLRMRVAGLVFQNPIVLAAGTAGYGEELDNVLALDRLGGFVTKAVSLSPRAGAPAPRVAEFDGGMINAVGLANPGLNEFVGRHVPWMSAHLPDTRKFVNVVGFETSEYAEVITGIEEALGRHPGAVDAYELNVSCPNVKAGGAEFGADPDALTDVVTRARAATKRPLFVKLSPALPAIARTAQTAVDAGASGITVVNTMPGLLIDVERRRPALGFGTGGVSGPALLPIGVLATWKVAQAVSVPVIGLGGVSSPVDVLQYLLAGASLVGIGTAAMKDPRLPGRVVSGLARWCAEHDVADLATVVGTLAWPT